MTPPRPPCRAWSAALFAMSLAAHAACSAPDGDAAAGSGGGGVATVRGADPFDVPISGVDVGEEQEFFAGDDLVRSPAP